MMRSTYLVVALLASVLLVVSFCNAQDQENPDLLLPSQGDGMEVGKKKPWPCCDMCRCTKSMPPQCQCDDVLVGGCHRNCKSCVCTLSIPPYCTCTDVIYEDCGKRCHREE
ncbi:unnamed protein product [Musa hybrid cultivar]